MVSFPVPESYFYISFGWWGSKGRKNKLNYHVLIFLGEEGEGFERIWRGSNYF